MEQIIISLVATVVGGLVILLIEYKYFKSNESSSTTNLPISKPSGKDQIKPQQIKYKTPREYLEATESIPEIFEENQKPPISDAYQRLALVLVSLASAYAASFLLRIWADDYAHTSQSLLAIFADMIASEDFIFLIVLLVMVISGALIAYLVDENVDTISASLLPRYFLTIIVSFVGAYLGCIIVPVLILIFIPKDSGRG
jgi:hypothetical protein